MTARAPGPGDPRLELFGPWAAYVTYQAMAWVDFDEAHGIKGRDHQGPELLHAVYRAMRN